MQPICIARYITTMVCPVVTCGTSVVKRLNWIDRARFRHKGLSYIMFQENSGLSKNSSLLSGIFSQTLNLLLVDMPWRNSRKICYRRCCQLSLTAASLSRWTPLSFACLQMSMSIVSLLRPPICNRAGHYIFILWFLSSIYLLSSFFLP